ncbi:CGNR zinc finger domain-containing protein [Spirilliplanes yamanashiensis]|uniref:Zinc finger CGNR domain-containing protein n=1 Tax=Spirilliplanes yamanashiensis TaxID=42233 RepID=A0A8J3YEE9_9ACTN|nr:CGNR zinc finger domain-containing protein [Spirilliplanes yamanashiensis]MDP9816649.1 putative RNA-binding Zn ribbon-like protein [Spirilliplanes yamanashiensis]GIJ06173.1 hypothetical protein Sya03_55250 [Spirilliplanes yamanashiensis]
MRLTHPDGQVFSFDAGALCLELACTTGGEGFRARFEVLHTPADLVRWAATSRLGDAAAGATATEADLALVRRLREAVWTLAWATATGDPADPAVIGVVNEVAALPTPIPRLTDGRAVWAGVTGAHLAAAIARDAVVTFGTAARERVRRCGGERCALIYLDTSRPGNRRWCSMERCGNRAKVRTHRRRDGGT